MQQENQNQAYDPNNTASTGSYNQPYYDPGNPYTTQPNQNFGPNPNSTNPNLADDPYQSPSMYPDYSQTYNTTDYQTYDNMPYDPATNAASAYPNPNQVDPNHNFNAPKSGNRIFLYGSIVLAVILLIATGVLIYLNRPGQTADTNPNTANTASTTTTQTTTPNSNSTSSSNGNSTGEGKTDSTTRPAQPTEANNSKTGGSNTPATKARKFNETKLPKTWLRKNFTSPDVDNDGNCLTTTKCGESSDPDRDGLSNIEEYNFGTDPLKADTDNDGLADGDEVFVYYSDPTNQDSDADGYKDAAELIGCYDPIVNSNAKMEIGRQTTISRNVGVSPLNEPTRSTLLKGEGALKATNSDISSKGYVSSACGTTTGANNTTPSTTTPTSSSTKPN
jgi:hypothetical protein